MDRLADQPQARAVFEPVIAEPATASHAYLLHGPPGSGRTEVARVVATALLAEGSQRGDTAARVEGRTHPDLTWVSPQGANGEVLVEDVRDRIVAAVPLTPFEAHRRVFVIEGADRMNESAANAFLKTLEEPPDFAHLILIADSLDGVMPTLVSRCQAVRFDPARDSALAAMLEADGIAPDEAARCAALADGDGARARLLAGEDGRILLESGEALASASLKGGSATARPWVELLAAAGRSGKAAADEVRSAATERLELAGRSERSKIEREAEEQGKRAQRRAESSAVDAALAVAESWLRDLHRAALGAADLIGDQGRRERMSAVASSSSPARVRSAIDLVGSARRSLSLNVNRELAIESLAHRLDRTLG